MQPTLYLADTCSLRHAETRAHWERLFSEQLEFCLTIPFTVISELRNQAAIPEAKEALAFLKKYAEHVILLPEEDGFPAKSEADGEIVYYCALRQEQEVVVYTEDQGLTSALTRINPLLEVRRVKNGMVTSASSSWVKRYADVGKNHIIYLTAACVNSPAFAAVMAQPGIAPLFRGRMILSTASLPLLNEQGKAVLRKLEERQLAPTLRVQGRLCISERDELMARLLTHSGTPGAMLWLGEEDVSDDYLDMSKMQFSALKHTKGYAVAVLKGNGRLYVLQSQTTEAVSAPSPAAQTEQAEPTPPQADSEQPVAELTKAPSLTNAEKKKMLIAWVLKGDVKNAGPLLQENHALIYDAVKVCLDRHTDRLLTLLNSLSQRKLQVPHRAFTYYVDTYLLKDMEAMKTHVNDADFQKVIRRMIKKLMPSPDGYAESIQALQHRKEELDGTEAARLQNLIDMVRTYADKK